MSFKQKKSILAYSFLGIFSLSVVLFWACTKKEAIAKPHFVFHSPPPAENIVAKIGNETITEESLLGPEKLTYYELQKKLYQLKMNRLKEVMVEKLFASKAQKASMSLPEYIDKKITKGIKISKKEYDAFVKDKRIPLAQITPQLKTRIEGFLKETKKQKVIDRKLAKLTQKNPVVVYFKKPRLNVQVDLGKAPLWGNKSAPVTIIEFSDFQCPFCARAAVTVEALRKKYKGKIKIAYKHFPLSFHQYAKMAAEASMCIYEQGNSKFWKFHDIVFKNQEKLSKTSLKDFAKKSGIQLKKYEACMKENRYQNLVQNDMKYGTKLGIRATPTFFINGELLSGAQPMEAFDQAISDALMEAKK